MGNKWLRVNQRKKDVFKSYDCKISYTDKLYLLTSEYLKCLSNNNLLLPKTEITLKNNSLIIKQAKIPRYQLNNYLKENYSDSIILKKLVLIILNTFFKKHLDHKTNSENSINQFGIDPSFSNFIVCKKEIYYVDIFPPILRKCTTGNTMPEIGFKDEYSFLTKFIPNNKYLFLFYTTVGIIVDIINHTLYYTRDNTSFNEISKTFFNNQYYSRFHKKIMCDYFELHKSLLKNYLTNKSLDDITTNILINKLDNFYSFFQK